MDGRYRSFNQPYRAFLNQSTANDYAVLILVITVNSGPGIKYPCARIQDNFRPLFVECLGLNL